MGSICSCFSSYSKQDDKQLISNQTKSSSLKGDITQVFNKNKQKMIPQLYQLYERCIKGESIRSIKIVQTPLSLQMAHLLSNLFSFSPKVDELVLKENQLGQEGAKVISEQIHHLKRLRKVKINHNSIGDTGFNTLITSLSVNKIEQLIFINNQISRHGIASLINILPYMENLRYFYLPFNQINSRGLMKLVSAAEDLSNLQEFIVDIENLSEEQLEEIQSRLPSVTLTHDNQNGKESPCSDHLERLVLISLRHRRVQLVRLNPFERVKLEIHHYLG